MKLDYTSEEILEILPHLTPEERAELDDLLLGAKTAEIIEIERTCWTWLSAAFPDAFDAELMPEHREFWEWFWRLLKAVEAGDEVAANEANVFLSIWSRHWGKSTHAELAMAAAVCVLGSGLFLYVSGTQDLSEVHLAAVEEHLLSPGVRKYYPQHSNPARSVIHHSTKAWNQTKLRTKGGAQIQAVGLNVGVRGIRKGKDRVRGFVLDDIDDYKDSEFESAKKANILGNSVLPTSSNNFFVIGAQNLITPHSVFNRIYTGQDRMLANRIVSGPFKAFEDLETEFIDGRDIITNCVERWPAYCTKAVGQSFIDTFGLIRFLAEFQHNFEHNRQGLVFSNYRDEIHVITWSQFKAVYGVDHIPDSWYKYAGNDWARTKTEKHANVMCQFAVSNQNCPPPYAGLTFLYNPMSFEPETQPDDVALRLLESMSAGVPVHAGGFQTWRELVSSTLTRSGLDAHRLSVTQFIESQRKVLQSVIPQYVRPLLKKLNFRRFVMSHEASNVQKVYRQVFGLEFQPVNPGKDGSVDTINLFWSINEDRDHLFKPGVKGMTRMYIIVKDEDAEYPKSMSSTNLHDSDLFRFQFSNWRWSEPKTNDMGEKVRGPMKQHDDAGNLCMMVWESGTPVAAPLTYGETVIAAMPEQSQPDNLRARSPYEKGLTPELELEALVAFENAKKQIKPRVQRFDENLRPMEVPWKPKYSPR